MCIDYRVIGSDFLFVSAITTINNTVVDSNWPSCDVYDICSVFNLHRTWRIALGDVKYCPLASLVRQ